MSVVTDTILTFDCLENGLAAIHCVNTSLTSADQMRGFVLTSEQGTSGGSKHHQMHIALAAFNHVSDGELVTAVRAYKWEDPEQVRLFVHHEEDENGFQELPWA